MIVVGLGPGRAGTSFFFNLVKELEIVDTSIIKETFHFDKTHCLKEYNKFFSGKEDIRFEISNRYIFHNKALKNISIANKVEKTIPLFFKRDESERLLSVVDYERRRGLSQKKIYISVSQRIMENEFNNQFLLKNFKEVTQGMSIYIIETESMKNINYLKKIINDIFNINVELNDLRKAILKIDNNKKIIARNKLVGRLASKTAVLLRKFEIFYILSSLKKNKIIKQIFFKEVESNFSDELYLKLERVRERELIRYNNNNIQ